MTRSKILTAFLLTMTAAVVLPDLANAVSLTPEQACRTALERRSRHYLTASLRARQKCLKKIFVGKTSPSVDCIDGTGDIKLANKLQGLQARVSTVLPKKCTGVNFELLGYPGPCPSSGVFDEADLEHCIINSHDEHAAGLLRKQYPSEGVLLPAFVRCVNAVGRHSAAMVRGDMFARQACLLAEEINPLVEATCYGDLPPYGTGTLDASIDDRIKRAHIRLLSGIPGSCGKIDIDSLDYTEDCTDVTGGSFTVFDLKFCLYDDHREMVANKFVEIAFPRASFCGDGQAEGAEECDDGNTDNTDTCLDDCTSARCGDDFECTASTCISGPGGGPEDCDDGNSVDDDLCGNDCGLNSCGDGEVQAGLGEECDDGAGNGNMPDACRADCKAPTCGDSITDPSNDEDCDDGNSVNDDLCGNDCGLNSCGDGEVQAGLGEECDDGTGNGNAPDACRADCKAPTCGDGIVDPGNNEQCDDGNDDPDDACDACKSVLCGNGMVDTEIEECDDGNTSNNDACLNSCVFNSCGDGFLHVGVESCDDGNESNNDPCLNTCADNVCGDGFVNPVAEDCDDGNEVQTDACLNHCRDNICGDGFVHAGVEDCDDGSGNSNSMPDACRTNCNLPSCGDGVADPSNSEECDDGSSNSDSTPDACRTDCSSAGCGDDVLDSGEECDGSAGGCDGGNDCSDCSCSNGCPSIGQATILAATGITSCSTDSDCLAGTCNTTLGLCEAPTSLDTGWTGIAHGADINDLVVQRANLECSEPFDGSSAEPCGECAVTGLRPDTRDCRCAGDNRAVCDEPFQNDADDCGGALCECYLGGPLPLSAGNTPACSVNKFAEDIFGTANVDLGEGQVAASLSAIAYLGINLILPCPACGGTCTAPAGSVGDGCAVDIHCDSSAGAADGVCGNYDTTAKDGVREGTCMGGLNDGESCDIDAYHSSFPAPGPSLSGQSLDCFPDPGKNVSGTGLKIALTQTTGVASLPPASITCGFPPFITYDCPCGQCSNDTTTPCSTDDQCSGGGTCEADGGGKPLPDQCTTTGNCVDLGGGQGECGEGPTDQLCDGIVRAGGAGFIGCLSNLDCEPGTIGIDAGKCTITRKRPCFLDPIVAVGTPDKSTPIGAAAFCIAKTANGGINSVAGLPGPARVVSQIEGKSFCASDESVQYMPGVGGCP